LSLQRVGVGVTVSLAATDKIAEQIKKIEEQAQKPVEAPASRLEHVD